MGVRDIVDSFLAKQFEISVINEGKTKLGDISLSVVCILTQEKFNKLVKKINRELDSEFPSSNVESKSELELEIKELDACSDLTGFSALKKAIEKKLRLEPNFLKYDHIYSDSKARVNAESPNEYLHFTITSTLSNIQQ